MNRTVSQDFDTRNASQQDIFPCTAIVVGVDYLARQVAINIRGRSGPRHVDVGKSIDMGTSTNPKIVVGSQVIVSRMEDKYKVIEQVQ